MELELAVLACVWLDEHQSKIKLSDISLDLFTDRVLAKRVLDYRKQGLPYDLLISKEHLGVDNTVRLVKALSGISGLPMYEAYFTRLKAKHLLTRINAEGPTVELVSNLWETVRTRKTNEKIYDFETDLHSYMDLVEKRTDKDTQRISIGKEFDEFTSYFNYLKPGQSIVVGARTGIGKTQMMVNFLNNFMQQDIACLYITAEVSYSEICDRLVAINSDKLTQWKVSNGEIKQEEWAEFTKTVESLHGKKSIVYEVSNFNLQKIKDLITRYNPQIVFIDFLQRFRLSGANRNETRASILSDIANEIKSIAMEKNITIISASQLNRNSDDKEPTNADFKESGGIEESADKCILIYGEIKTTTARSVKVKISKNRNGIAGDEFEFCFNNRTGKLQYLGKVDKTNN